MGEKNNKKGKKNPHMHPKNILIQISIPVNEITYCMHCSSLGILNPYIFMVCAFVCVCV